MAEEDKFKKREEGETGNAWIFRSTIVPEGEMHVAEVLTLSAVLVLSGLILPMMIAALPQQVHAYLQRGVEFWQSLGM